MRTRSERKKYLVGVAGNLAVEVEDHTLLLHGLEDGVIDVVALNARLAVSRHTARVRLHTYHAPKTTTAISSHDLLKIQRKKKR